MSDKERVEELNFSRKNLTDVPDDINQYNNLLRLDLSHNSILKIENIQNYRLDKLDLSHNKIVLLGNLSSLRSLRSLDAQCNYCSIASLRGLQNLRVLILKRNSFFDLPDLRDLHTLRVLDCSFNKLSKLPDLSYLRNLKILRVNNNLIENIPQLPNSVEMFNIGSNRLTSFLGIRILENCKRLHNLILCNNPFTHNFFQNGINYRPFVVSFYPNLRELDVDEVTEEDRTAEAEHVEIFHDADNDTEFINQLHRSLLIGMKKSSKRQQQSRNTPNPDRQPNFRLSESGDDEKEEEEEDFEAEEKSRRRRRRKSDKKKKHRRKKKHGVPKTPFHPSPIKMVGEHIDVHNQSSEDPYSQVSQDTVQKNLTNFRSIDVRRGEEILGDERSSPTPTTPRGLQYEDDEEKSSKKKKKRRKRASKDNGDSPKVKKLHREIHRLEKKIEDMNRMFDLLVTREDQLRDAAARKIQFYCRRRLSRKRLGFYKYRRMKNLQSDGVLEEKTERTKDEIIKFLWEEVKEMRKWKEREIFERQNNAAIVIQKYWKGHVTRRWYRKLRIEFLKFKTAYITQQNRQRMKI